MISLRYNPTLEFWMDRDARISPSGCSIMGEHTAGRLYHCSLLFVALHMKGLFTTALPSSLASWLALVYGIYICSVMYASHLSRSFKKHPVVQPGASMSHIEAAPSVQILEWKSWNRAVGNMCSDWVINLYCCKLLGAGWLVVHNVIKAN